MISSSTISILTTGKIPLIKTETPSKFHLYNKGQYERKQCEGLTLKKKQCRNWALQDNYYCNLHKDKFKLQKPETCGVCFENFETNVLPLSCGHWIHRPCILTWGKEICPICRQQITLTQSEKKIIARKKAKNKDENNNTINAFTANFLAQFQQLMLDEQYDVRYSEDLYELLTHIVDISIFGVNSDDSDIELMSDTDNDDNDDSDYSDSD